MKVILDFVHDWNKNEDEAHCKEMGALSDLEHNKESNSEDILGAGLGDNSMHPMSSFMQETELAIEDTNDPTIEELRPLTANVHQHGMFMLKKVSHHSCS